MKVFQTVIVILTSLVMSISFSSAEEKNSEMLLGIITSADLQKEPYARWYIENSDGYQVDEASLEDLKNLMKGVDVKIMMGTWCHDSKREVPRFFKILSVSRISEGQVEMIAVDQNKQAPNGGIDDVEFTNTPTFIFYKNGQELNRIVEKPVESIEKDMVKILSGQTYRHSKMPN